MRIGAIAFVRLIVMLRRIWKSLDQLVQVEQDRLALERDRMALQFPIWDRSGGKLPDNPQKTVYNTVNVEDLNKKWLQNNPDEE